MSLGEFVFWVAVTSAGLWFLISLLEDLVHFVSMVRKVAQGGCHRLKTETHYFNLVKDGVKPFEVRLNDRNFQTGDLVILEDWNPYKQRYTGKRLLRRITCVLPGPAFGIAEGYCVFGIETVF